MYEIDKPKKNHVTIDGTEIAPKSVNGVLMPVTEKEAKAIVIDIKEWKDSADTRTLKWIRSIREGILNRTDWKVIKTIEQGKELSEEFKTWRKNLRDIPQNYKASDYDKLIEIDNKTKELKHSVWQEPKI